MKMRRVPSIDLPTRGEFAFEVDGGNRFGRNQSTFFDEA